MTVKTGKKIGFFAALTMMVGSVIGIGIFFKSHGILRLNDWNGTGTLIAWLLGGLLALAAAISFMEIGSMKTKNVSGVPAYAEKLGGIKFGYFARFNYSFFYFGILSVALAMFGSEILVGTFTSFYGKGADVVPLYGHALIAMFIAIFFLVVNMLSIKTSGIIAQVSTVLKWIPLVVVAVLGIALASTNLNSSDPLARRAFGMMFGHNAFSNGRSFTFVGMLAALPAVLFAYDSFLNVLSMKEKIYHGEERLPKIIIFGMISVIALYTLIAVAAILHGTGMVSGFPFGVKPQGVDLKDPAGNTLTTSGGFGIFDQIFGAKTAELFGKMVVVFLAISVLGVINGVSATAVAVHEQNIATNTLFGARALKEKFGPKKALMIHVIFITIFWGIVMFVPMIILRTDSFIDGISNFPTLLYFSVHGTIILIYSWKRKDVETKKINNFIFRTFSIIAILGIFFVVGYQVFYGFFINAILHPSETTHWGLYIGDANQDTINNPAFPPVKLGQYMTLAQASIMMWFMILIFLFGPRVNRALTETFEDNDVIVNTQE